MIVDVIMPKLGESITEGTIIEWKKGIGDSIIQDETILEISTDKVDSEVPSPSPGKLIEILYNQNDVVPVGEVIARIGSDGEDAVDSMIEEKKIEKVESKEDISIPIKNKEEKQEINSKPKLKSSSRFYSPLVRSIAKMENISNEQLDRIQGSGKNGRVSKSLM